MEVSVRKSTKIYLLIFTSLYGAQLQAIGPFNPILWENIRRSGRAKPTALAPTAVTKAILIAPITTTITLASLTSAPHIPTVSTRIRDHEELLFLLSGPFQ